ncbi:PP2C family protein-serine/threonine phosphatase [Desulforegula conservatrix]|uniref:PP2C family protein-serine/threonine phosphatase n=1 Tax=Desulforegula conservatrix TaxID=153026 RepID=UPI000401734E|nr:fused response regulator/phosphatase [Desulforegula conservatrix]
MTSNNETQGYSILAVDDNPVNLTYISTVLSKEGYTVYKAKDAAAAKIEAVQKRPDLILLDIVMPGEDGFSVIKYLKNHSSTTSIPVIFLTGQSELDSKLTGFELGAVDYIIKPFQALEVLARVRLHLKMSIATNSLIASQASKLKQIKEAQKSMLAYPEMLPEAKFGVYYKALEEAGGDFYDVLRISENIFSYFVADFSGHDIKTSYMTSSVKALLRQNCNTVYQPMESMKMINDVLSEILPEGKYLTASYVRLNRRTKQVIIVSCGHPPVVYVSVSGEVRLINLEGDILGLFKDVYFGSEVIDVSVGDRFYLYSDGVTESSKRRVMWSEGAKFFAEACANAKDTEISSAPRKIITDIFGDDFIPEDDMAILGFEV